MMFRSIRDGPVATCDVFAAPPDESPRLVIQIYLIGGIVTGVINQHRMVRLAGLGVTAAKAGCAVFISSIFRQRIRKLPAKSFLNDS
jgi:hypothetical protein